MCINKSSIYYNICILTSYPTVRRVTIVSLGSKLGSFILEHITLPWKFVNWRNECTIGTKSFLSNTDADVTVMKTTPSEAYTNRKELT